jgi:hypothetical protein
MELTADILLEQCEEPVVMGFGVTNIISFKQILGQYAQRG